VRSEGEREGKGEEDKVSHAVMSITKLANWTQNIAESNYWSFTLFSIG
jgi:hypothetical protein